MPRGGEFADHKLVIFGDGEHITPRAADAITGDFDALDVLILGGIRIGEPISLHGGFVMNTSREIEQALDDFRAGRLGAIPVDQLAPARSPELGLGQRLASDLLGRDRVHRAGRFSVIAPTPGTDDADDPPHAANGRPIVRSQSIVVSGARGPGGNNGSPALTRVSGNLPSTRRDHQV